MLEDLTHQKWQKSIPRMKSIGNKPIFPPFLGWETFLFKVDTSKECQDLGVTCERWDILKGTERDVLVHIYIFIDYLISIGCVH